MKHRAYLTAAVLYPLGLGLVLLLLPCRGWTQGAVSDPLDQDNGVWPREEGWTFANGALHVPCGRVGCAYDFGDGLAQIETEHCSGDLTAQYGLLFRGRLGDGRANGYSLRISAQGCWKILRYTQSDWSDVTPWAHSDAVNTGEGAKNTLGVVCLGTEINVVINGQRIATINDGSYSYGKVGVENGKADGQADVAFRNLKIDPNYLALDSAATGYGAAAGGAASAIVDPLDHENGKWPAGQGGQFENGACHLRGECFWTGYQLRDGLAQIEAERVSGSVVTAHGLAFRMALREGGWGGYAVCIAAGRQWHLRKLSGGKWSDLTPWRKSDHLYGATKNTLGVLCRGADIRVRINGSTETVIQDAEFAEGGVGPLGNSGADTAFRNLKLDPNYGAVVPLADAPPARTQPPAGEPSLEATVQWLAANAKWYLHTTPTGEGWRSDVEETQGFNEAMPGGRLVYWTNNNDRTTFSSGTGRLALSSRHTEYHIDLSLVRYVKLSPEFVYVREPETKAFSVEIGNDQADCVVCRPTYYDQNLGENVVQPDQPCRKVAILLAAHDMRDRVGKALTHLIKYYSGQDPVVTDLEKIF